ncbi:gluconokinase [Demequina aurantiaca]|uniref:gluconokinase n=1 Tax=Demequina aurantiaca TaxID=676200 RepID=UPI00078322FE|nr:gluconokinase [Demequina aurantiaca]
MRVVVMGVTGCGKTSVGVALANAWGSPFADADAFHPEANVAKMTVGTPLSDDDRWPWLDAVGTWLGGRPDAVVACSALRRSYREVLLSHAPDAVFVHLAAPQAVLEERVRARSAATDHFAGTSLLDSQYATLEPLAGDEPGVTADVSGSSIGATVEAVRERLAALAAGAP